MDTTSIILLVCAVAMFLLVIVTPLTIIILTLRWLANLCKKSYRSVRK